jgi:hypothetical protein
LKRGIPLRMSFGSNGLLPPFPDRHSLNYKPIT